MKKITVLAFVALSGIAFSQSREKKDSIREKSIDEIVLIGYGEVRKSDLTGSITTIKPNEEDKNQAQGIENLIQGKASGVVVTSMGSEPSAPVDIKVRGINSLSNGTQPLYVIDGVIVSSSSESEANPLSAGNSYLAPQNGLMGINPKDIESLEILKDASATAIYGSRASNGVVIITTKKGKKGKAKFNYSAVTKIGQITRPIDVLDGLGYAEYQNKSRQLKGLPVLFNIDSQGKVFDATTGDLMKEVNWSDLMYRNSLSLNHRLSVSGGSEKSKYYFAAGYSDAQGIVPNSFAKQTDFTTNLSNELSDKLTLDTKFSLSYTRTSSSKGTENLGGTNDSMVRQIISGAPYFNYSGNLTADGNADESATGPQAWAKDYDDFGGELRGLGSLKADYKINNVFKYRLLVGVDYRNKERKIWYGTSLFRGNLANGEAGISNLDRFRYNVDNTLLFNKKFDANNRIDGTFGFIIDQVLLKASSVQATDFPIKTLRADGIQYGNVYSPFKYYTEPTSIMSFIGRANYTLYNRYNLTATVRGDGSSRFAKGRRWGYFPAFAFAWQLKKEKFLQSFSKLSEAKVRLGWGITGNQNTSPFQYYVTYTNTANPYPTSGGSSISLVPKNIANPDITWETTHQKNAGIDLGFFHNRLKASFDFYDKQTKDLLINLVLPGSSGGFSDIKSNTGGLSNKGFEVSISADVIKNDNVKWNFYGNLSKYKNKITDYPNPPKFYGTGNYAGYIGSQVSGGNYFKTFANVFFDGYPAGMFWGYETNGIIDTAEKLAIAPKINDTAPQLGDLAVVDRNGDGIITDADKTFIGDPNPKFTYGFGTNFEYKNFTLSIFFNGVYGNKIANGNLIRDAFADGTAGNVRADAFYNAWSPQNPNGTNPRVNYTQILDLGFFDRMVEDGSFLRLQNVTLGYRIPMKNSFIQNIDFSFTGSNLMLWTKYTGYDPEVDSFSFDSGRRSIDWQSFPNQKTYSFGINANF